MPIFLAKGLEFDAVIITDVIDSVYRSTSATTLYTACTRAFHRLYLISEGITSKLISSTLGDNIIQVVDRFYVT